MQLQEYNLLNPEVVILIKSPAKIVFMEADFSPVSLITSTASSGKAGSCSAPACSAPLSWLKRQSGNTGWSGLSQPL